MTHGTLYSYVDRGCRCEPCKAANRDYRRLQRKRGAAYLNLTAEQRRHCLICGVALSIHPFKACWREIR